MHETVGVHRQKTPLAYPIRVFLSRFFCKDDWVPSLLLPGSTATAQLQEEWQGTFPEGEPYRFAMTLLAEVSAEVLEVTLETLVKGRYTS